MQETINYQDIIKKSFMDMHSTGGLTIADIGLTLTITFLISLGIFWVYKKTFKGVLYTQSFNISLVMISMVTSLVIMTISTNLILSLGMVGALSIVRFRTAVKDPLDIVFMFWAIAVGIANGAMHYELSLVGSLFIGVILYLFTNVKVTNNPYLLVINYQKENDNEILTRIKENISKFKLKSKTISNNDVELTLEVRVIKDDVNFMNAISSCEKINNVVLVSYDGEYVS